MFRAAWRHLQSIDLNSQRAARLARIAVPLAFGFVSLLLGQDTNWDLYNYHLYNAYALLGGRLGLDLAPAWLQSYFNPLLDVPYFVAQRQLPAPLIGFAMGWLHGLCFVLVFAIAQSALATLPDRDRVRVPLLLATAGCLTANFLSALGNTMGDNTTALLVLGALLVILKHWDALREASGVATAAAVGAGVLAGLAAGLKLTNAVYAVAMGAALLAYPATWPQRMRLAAWFGCGTVLGFALTGGYWLYVMWRTFGNPLFPQFGDLFPNPLARSIGVADSRWRPNGVVEAALWPFIIALDPLRAGQLRLHQVIWPIAYLLCGWLLVVVLRGGARASSPLDPRARFLLAFVGLGFAGWMAMFSIYRYLVAVEVIAPLAVFVLLCRLLGYDKGRRAAAWVLVGATCVVLAGGVRTWGHEGWAMRAFGAELPPLPDAARTTALVVAEDPPYGWLVPLFPAEVAFAGLGGGPLFDTPAYAARVAQMLATRGGPVFAVAEGHDNWREHNIARANGIVAALGLGADESRCRMLRSIVSTLRLRAEVADLEAGAGGVRCRLRMLAADERDMTALNRASAEKVGATLRHYGLALDPPTCTLHFAYAGAKRRAYQWCPVARGRIEP